MPLDLISGRPGTRWRNDTRTVWYQLRVLGVNTCAFCWSLDGMIARSFAIPYHRGCRCRAYEVFPGESAPMPFVDYRKRIARLPADQKAAAVGANLYRLIKGGVVGWDDVVASDDSRVRSLAEVVAVLGLSVKRMTRAGVPLFVARRAEEDAKRPPAEVEAEHRESVRRRLQGPGEQSRSLVDDLIRAGAGATLAGGFLSTPHGRRQADELAALLGEPGS